MQFAKHAAWLMYVRSFSSRKRPKRLKHPVLLHFCMWICSKATVLFTDLIHWCDSVKREHWLLAFVCQNTILFLVSDWSFYWSQLHNIGTVPVLMSLSYQFCRHHKCGITDSLAFQLVKLCWFHALRMFIVMCKREFVCARTKEGNDRIDTLRCTYIWKN